MPRPNILFITSDQHRADGYGFVNPVLKTPHLDRLAARPRCCQAVLPAGFLW